MATLRICFVGDSITVGSGDTDFLGWPGRACIAETQRGHDDADMTLPFTTTECGATPRT